jgi:cytochrome bd-type quinol oxidase subunit 2
MISYETIPLLMIVIYLYGITYILYKENMIKIHQHMRIWNIILLVFSVILIISSLLITIFAEYNITTPLSATTKFIHVESGIILIPIGFIHIYFHRKNFKRNILN